MKHNHRFQDSAIAAILRLLWDLTVFNFLWILCCIPVFTIGPAICALFSVTLRLADDSTPPSVKNFFDAFSSNFRQGLLIELLCVVMAFVAYTDTMFALRLTGTYKTVFFVVATILVMLLITLVCYVFPLQARFQNKLSEHIRNTFALACCAPFHTILMWLSFLVPILLPIFFFGVVVQTVGFMYLMVGAALPAFLISKLCLKVFSKVEKAKSSL